MTTPNDPDSTRRAVILAAEELFGRQGIAATSLRSVVAASRQKNATVVQYHFGGKDGLVEGILRERRGEVGAQVGADLAAMLARPGGLAGVSFQDLVKVGLRPIFQLKNRAGRRTYSLFLRAVLFEVRYQSAWADRAILGPHPQKLLELMRSRIKVSDEVFAFRTRTLQACFHEAVAQYDALRAAKATRMSENDFFEEITAMLARAWDGQT